MIWFRTYDDEDDVWVHYEADDGGRAVRQVDIRAADSRPVTAASLDELAPLCGDMPVMGRYERQYGVLTEGLLDGWQDQPHAMEIPRAEFERLWAEARRTLGGETAWQVG